MIIADSHPGDKTLPKQITLVLVDTGNDSRTMACRAKQLLKLALRGFHMRCTEARGLGTDEVQP